MPPIAIGPACPVSCAKPVAGNPRPAAAALDRAPRDDALRAASTDRSASAVAHRASLDPGPPPVDAERVAHIRKAIETGTYPLVPAAVADAFIAAGYMLRNPR